MLSADGWEEAGFKVAPLPPEIEQEIEKVVPELWRGWIRNPVDASILPEQARDSNLAARIAHMMAASPHFDLIIGNIGLGAPATPPEMAERLSREAGTIKEVKRNTTKPVLAVLNTGSLGVGDFDDPHWRSYAEANTKLIEAQIPVYRTPEEAAGALIQLVGYYQRRGASH